MLGGCPRGEGRAPKSVKLEIKLDFTGKIADRFAQKNRGPIFRSVCGIAIRMGFQSQIDYKSKIAMEDWL